MSRLTEALFLLNCTPEEWAKYSKTHIHHVDRWEVKKVRAKYRTKTTEQ